MEYHEDYHVIRERAGERVDHHGTEQRPMLNLKKGKESVKKTTCSVKEEINETYQVSDKGV